MDEVTEATLFLGLCKLFTQKRVLDVYELSLTKLVVQERSRPIPDLARSRGDDCKVAAYPKVFIGAASSTCAFGRKYCKALDDFYRNDAVRVVRLLRGLLAMFDLSALRDAPIAHKPGETPQHMLFLFLIQLLALFVSNSLDERDLATVLAVASAPFLESNFCDPLCAASLLKPLFVPYCEHRGPHARGTGGRASAAESEVKYYKLFSGYQLDNQGADVSSCMDEGITWTDHSISRNVYGFRVSEESSGEPLWFVAPQFGDRLRMMASAGDADLVSSGERADRIKAYLACDNFFAYLQGALFGTIANMLPCDAHSDFNYETFKTIKGSLALFSKELRRDSCNRMEELSRGKTCLGVAGVGFSTQDSGRSLMFGKVFTGPPEKCPPPDKNIPGSFVCVTLGMARRDTTVSALLTVSLSHCSTDDMKYRLSSAYEPRQSDHIASNFDFYGLFQPRFNRGEYTEVACVKSQDDRAYNQMIHRSSLTSDAKYYITLMHAALPMCPLTLAMTMRQTAMMVTGFFVAHVARLVYSSRQSEAVVHNVTSLSMACSFRHHNEEESENTFRLAFGNLIKISGKAFVKAGLCGPNFSDLDEMEWLRANDARLPENVRASLQIIGDTKTEVAKIMREENVSYTRVWFVCNGMPLKFATSYAHEECMVMAPFLVTSNMRIFVNNSQCHGSLKLSRYGACYYVGVYSNMRVDTRRYSVQNGCAFLTDYKEGHDFIVKEIAENIIRNVSQLKPRVNLGRVKLMGSCLNEKDFKALLLALEKKDIDVGEQVENRYTSYPLGAQGEGNAEDAVEEENSSHEAANSLNLTRPTKRTKTEEAAEAEDAIGKGDKESDIELKVKDPESADHSQEGETRAARSSGFISVRPKCFSSLKSRIWYRARFLMLLSSSSRRRRTCVAPTLPDREPVDARIGEPPPAPIRPCPEASREIEPNAFRLERAGSPCYRPTHILFLCTVT
ncbi:hypothetical protein WMY93_031103 [Mugilogobius chulae]|uniref:Uncharacterized protein n=1 Tax=Mugilogobius chulae TaxID=88201 RepID=A0AAW0MJG5_9GOBI